MATNIQLVTYAGQTVTPLDDSLIYENALTSGIIYGCGCTLVGGNTIHMMGGHGIICGRKFTVFESDTAVPLSSSGTLNGRMKVHLDLADTGEPIRFIIETAASLPALVQQSDVNINNGVYEFAMCTFKVTTQAVTNFAQAFPLVDVMGLAQLTATVATKVAKTDVVNGGGTASGTTGKVLDARQANPAINGSLAHQVSQLNSRLTHLTQIGNLYRFSVTSGSVATNDLIPMTKDYTADDNIYVSDNAIHFAKSGTVRVAVHITGQATGTIKRMWAKIMGGNYTAHSISYGDYGTLELTADFAVTTATAITLIALSDMVVNGGSTAYSMVCVHWLG